MKTIQTQILPDMMYKTKKNAIFKNRLSSLSNSLEIEFDVLYGNLKKTIEILKNEKADYRPRDNENNPGGIIYLDKKIPTLIIPDLHSRRDYLINALFDCKINNVSNLSLLSDGKLQIVCLGDGMHSENRGYSRWRKALDEYEDDFNYSPNMDEEMIESFSLMQMIMQLKILSPHHFHFLKGNHENILCEEGQGNHPFAKFSLEGPMVKKYLEIKLGKKFLQTYSKFEKLLPLFAVGKNFLISHAEPKTYYSKDEIINYKANAHVVEGLTWTDNDEASDYSVQKMLISFLGDKWINSFYFGGHRQVAGKYNIRANGQFIQVNNQKKMYVIYLPVNGLFNPEKNIIDVSVNFVEEEVLKTVKLNG